MLIEDQGINPHTYGHLIFDKQARNMPWENDSIFNKFAGQTGGLNVEDCKLIYFYHPAQTQVQVYLRP